MFKIDFKNERNCSIYRVIFFLEEKYLKLISKMKGTAKFIVWFSSLKKNI